MAEDKKTNTVSIEKENKKIINVDKENINEEKEENKRKWSWVVVLSVVTFFTIFMILFSFFTKDNYVSVNKFCIEHKAEVVEPFANNGIKITMDNDQFVSKCGRIINKKIETEFLKQEPYLKLSTKKDVEKKSIYVDSKFLVKLENNELYLENDQYQINPNENFSLYEEMKNLSFQELMEI